MAYTAGNLGLLSHANGFSSYRYDTTDDINGVVEATGYFNNKDDNLNLQVGDTILTFEWSNVVGTKGQSGTAVVGILSLVKMYVVTNVVSNDAAADAGDVNVAEILISTAGAISSGG